MQKELDKMALTVPVTAQFQAPVSTPPLPDPEHRVLNALFDLRAFVTDHPVHAIAERAGLDEAATKAAVTRCVLDGLVASNGFAAGGHLTGSGQQYVREQRGQAPGDRPIMIKNTFYGPTQYATGDNASQSMTNSTNTIDVALLAEVIAAIRNLDTRHLDDEERGSLRAGLSILDAQVKSPTALPGFRRALRAAMTAAGRIAEKVGTSATVEFILKHADELIAALP
jgi:hypothetical protein